jgi:hypothetical protein
LKISKQRTLTKKQTSHLSHYTELVVYYIYLYLHDVEEIYDTKRKRCQEEKEKQNKFYHDFLS